MFGKVWGWRLFRLGGFDVILDYTFAIAVVFALFSARGLITNEHTPFGTALLEFVGSVLLFFVSVLLHELSHAFVGKALGAEIKAVRIHAFGGWTTFIRPVDTDKKQFLVCLAGPGANLLLAALCFGPAMLLNNGSIAPVVIVLLWVAFYNVILGVFNLLPALPFDGGKVLQSGLLWATHREALAAKVMAITGRVTAIGLALLVIPAVLALGISSGIILAVLAFVVYRLSQQQAKITAKPAAPQAILIDVPTRDIWTEKPSTRPEKTNALAYLPSGESPIQTTQTRVTPPAAPAQDVVLFQKGQEYHAGGRYTEAIAAFTQAISLAPRNSQYLLYRAYAYTALKNEAAATADLETILRFEPKNATALTNLAHVAITRQDYGKACDAYTRLTQAVPTNAQAFYDLAGAHARLIIRQTPPGTVEAMVAALNTAFRLNPTLREHARTNPVFAPLRFNPAVAAFLDK